VWCATGNSAPSNGYDITYVVDEPRRLTGGVTTLFGTNEGSLVMKLTLINSNVKIIIIYAFLCCYKVGKFKVASSTGQFISMLLLTPT